MGIKPFHFKLKKVSPDEARIMKALFEFLPYTSVREQFHGALKAAFKKHIGIDADYSLEGVGTEAYGALAGGAGAVFIIISAPPFEGRMIVELEGRAAVFIVERLLGSQAESSSVSRALSDIEQGALEYFLLQIFSTIHKMCGKDARLHFRFDKFALSPKTLKGVMPDDEEMKALTIRLTLGGADDPSQINFIKIYLPHTLINSIGVSAELKPSEFAFAMGALKKIDYINVPVTAEVGSSVISSQDLEHLEEGDVVVFDKTHVRFSEKGIEGQAVLRFGEGSPTQGSLTQTSPTSQGSPTRGGLQAEIKIAPKNVICRIVGVSKEEEIL